MTNNFYDVIIIGGGPGGLTAATYTSRANMKTLLLDGGFPGGQLQNTAEIENYPGFDNISGPDLAQHMFEQALKFGTEYKYGIVESINPAEYTAAPFFFVETAKEIYSARSVIIATGTKYRTLNIPGEKEFTGRGVSWCAVCDGAFYKEKHVVVVGGGDSAVEEAVYLTKFASKVTIIHRREKFRAKQILVDRLLKNEKIEIIYNSVVEEIVGDEKVTSVLIKDVNSGNISNLSCDGVFEYVGMDPISGFVKNLKITDEFGWIITDSKMQVTSNSISGLYAIGDVRKDAIRQVVTAAGDGCVAAQMAQHYVEMWNN
ncbi:ribonucleotide reductase large subunit [Bacillus phage G]|uniref:Gp344 n=1 Tax=Bacillus phage G TaxID=2884420 RepID=G3MA85_9CAUD|nr:ribonucleotide reductase large subunit [Bacillus phage G]AEO93603.1 gp344 [Bacillus phage G]